MPNPIPTAPLLYSPSMEHLEDDETETTQEMIETLRKINETTYKHSGHATRSVHAKTHGLLVGEMTVGDGLPSVLAQGLFAKPGTYPVVARLSTLPGDILDDNVSTPRGLAIKIVGVDGQRLEGSEDAVTQDFVMVNGPAFAKPDAKTFLRSLKLLASTTDKGEGLKKAFSAVARVTEKAIESVGGESATLKTMGGHPETNILGETFYTQVPMLYGPYMVKLSVVPVSSNLTALTDAPVDLKDKPNGLRDAVMQHFAGAGGEWEVRVQFCTDAEAMPIEDASVVWPEDKSPYITVARITMPPQSAWNEARASSIDDGLAFSPWHGLAEHRPLGSIMRVRKAAYETMARYRADHNGRKISEPRSAADLPD